METNDQDKQAGLVILNQRIIDRNIFEKLWDYSKFHIFLCKQHKTNLKASIRICADGASNRLYDFFETDTERKKHVPDFLVGDMDSSRSEVIDFYTSVGTKVSVDKSEYATDFMKSVKQLKEASNNGITTLYVLGGIGGRVDQGFHSIHQLLQLFSDENIKETFLVSEESISFLIPVGKTEIKTPLKYLGQTCGIIPLLGETHITTKGLKWDVSNWETQFGTQMSTSNHLINDEISIETDRIVLFTAEIRHI